MLAPLEGVWRLLLFLVPYAVVGWDVLWKAVRNILHGQVFDENFLMALATVGAFCIGEYPEGVLVMLLYQVGELFQDLAVDRSRRSIASLMDIRPDWANIEREGKLVQVSPEKSGGGGDHHRQARGAHPPGRHYRGGHLLSDTAALTGESLPRASGSGG